MAGEGTGREASAASSVAVGGPSEVRVLVVESSRSGTTASLPSSEPLEVMYVPSVDEALREIRTNLYDVMIVDQDLVELSGLTLIQKARLLFAERGLFPGFILVAKEKLSREEESLLRELGDIETVTDEIAASALVSAIQTAKELGIARRSRDVIVSKIRNYLQDGGSPQRAEELILPNLSLFGSGKAAVMLEVFGRPSMYDRGLEILQELLASDPKNLSLVNAVASLLLRAGRHEQAKACFETLDRLAPGQIDRLYSMVTTYLALQKPDAATNKMRELITLSPEQPELKFTFFAELCEAGFGHHAEQFCQLTSEATEVVRYYNNKGIMLARLGQPAEGIKAYEQALLFFPGFTDIHKVHYNIALAATAIGDWAWLKKAEKAVVLAEEMAGGSFYKAKLLAAKIQLQLSVLRGLGKDRESAGSDVPLEPSAPQVRPGAGLGWTPADHTETIRDDGEAL